MRKMFLILVVLSCCLGLYGAGIPYVINPGGGYTNGSLLNPKFSFNGTNSANFTNIFVYDTNGIAVFTVSNGAIYMSLETDTNTTGAVLVAVNTNSESMFVPAGYVGTPSLTITNLRFSDGTVMTNAVATDPNALTNIDTRGWTNYTGIYADNVNLTNLVFGDGSVMSNAVLMTTVTNVADNARYGLPNPPLAVVFDGDSLTADWYPATNFTYSYQLLRMSWWSNAITAYTNQAISGQYLADVTNRLSNSLAYFAANSDKNPVMFLWIGANDLVPPFAADGGRITSLESWQSTYVNLCSNIMANGITLVTFTVTERVGPGCVSETLDRLNARNAMNFTIRTNQYKSYLVDMALAEPDMCPTRNPWTFDGLHPNIPGGIWQAMFVDVSIRSGYGSYFPKSPGDFVNLLGGSGGFPVPGVCPLFKDPVVTNLTINPYGGVYASGGDTVILRGTLEHYNVAGTYGAGTWKMNPGDVSGTTYDFSRYSGTGWDLLGSIGLNGFIGNGIGLTNIQGSNVVGLVTGALTNLTPWTSDIDGAGYSLTNAKVSATSITGTLDSTNIPSPLVVDQVNGGTMYITNGIESGGGITNNTDGFWGNGVGLTNLGITPWATDINGNNKKLTNANVYAKTLFLPAPTATGEGTLLTRDQSTEQVFEQSQLTVDAAGSLHASNEIWATRFYGDFHGNLYGTNLIITNGTARVDGVSGFKISDGTYTNRTFDITSQGHIEKSTFTQGGTNVMEFTTNSITGLVPFYGDGIGLTNVPFAVATNWAIAPDTYTNLSGIGFSPGWGMVSSWSFSNVPGVGPFGIRVLEADTNCFITTNGGTFTGAIIDNSSSATAPSSLQLVNAQWVRSLFSGSGTWLYNITNAHPRDGDWYQAAASTNSAQGVRTYNAVTNNQYLGTGIMSTQVYTEVRAPITVDAYLSFNTGSTRAVTVKPEIYYVYTNLVTGTGTALTNLLGDYDCGGQALTSGTNLYSFVISFPTISSPTNPFYIVRRFKVVSQNANPNVSIYGSGATPSRLTLSLPSASSILSTVYASNVVSGGVLPMGTVSASTATAGLAMGTDGTLRIWTNSLPGVNAGTATIATNFPSGNRMDVSTLGITVDGGESVITTGTKGYLEVPFACTISAATLLCDQVGNASIAVYRTNSTGFPPTVVGSLGTNTVTGTNWTRDGTLTGWTTSLAANDVLGFAVIGTPATVTRATLQLKVTR